MGVTIGGIIGLVIGITLCYWIAKGFLNAIGNIANKIKSFLTK